MVKLDSLACKLFPKDFQVFHDLLCNTYNHQNVYLVVRHPGIYAFLRVAHERVDEAFAAAHGLPVQPVGGA